MRKTVVAIVAVAALLLAGPAAAHVTVQPNEVLIGSFSRFVVRVPNERPDASTIKVEVEFPPLAFVSFQDIDGWERTVEMQTLDEPLEVFGEQITETVGTVTWEGGEIEPGEFEEFGFSARMPEGTGPLEFPALQTYDSGEVVRWIGPPDSEEPAALVQVLDIGAGEGQGQLAVISDLSRGTAAEEEDGSGNLAVILGWIGVGLGALALVVALARRRT